LSETSNFVDVIEDAVVFQMERWNNKNIWSKIHLFPEIKNQESNFECIVYFEEAIKFPAL